MYFHSYETLLSGCKQVSILFTIFADSIGRNGRFSFILCWEYMIADRIQCEFDWCAFGGLPALSCVANRDLPRQLLFRWQESQATLLQIGNGHQRWTLARPTQVKPWQLKLREAFDVCIVHNIVQTQKHLQLDNKRIIYFPWIGKRAILLNFNLPRAGKFPPLYLLYQYWLN